MAQIAAGRLVGRTEADVAREVRERLLAEGHDEATFAIVGSGPNSASPHHEASDRVIGAGEPIVLDIGGVLGGYGSDTTRTLWVTGGDPAKGPDERFRHLFAVLAGGPGRGDPIGPSRDRLRGRRRGRPATDRGRRLRRGVLPSDRSRHRPRGPRGAVHHRRQPRAAAGGDGLLGRAGDLPARRVRRPDRGHRGLRSRRSASRSTSRPRELLRRRRLRRRFAGSGSVRAACGIIGRRDVPDACRQPSEIA